MAALNLYLTNTITNGWQTLSQTSPGANAVTSPNTGWVVGKIASGNYASLDSAVERTTAGFTATVQPDGTLDSTLGDAFIVGPLSGEFANSAWTIQAALQSTTNATATNAVSLRFRVFRSSNINGSGATEITASTILVPASTFYSLTTIGTQVTASNTWSPGTTLLLDSEYLFFQVACYINAASSSNSSDVNFRIGDTATLITTPDFVATNRDVTVSGTSSTISVGSVSRSASTGVSLAGVYGTSAVGIPGISSTLLTTGITGYITQGDVDASTQVNTTISGNALLSNIGSVLATNSKISSISAVSSVLALGTVYSKISLNITQVSSNSTIGSTNITIGKSTSGNTSNSVINSFNNVLTSNSKGILGNLSNGNVGSFSSIDMYAGVPISGGLSSLVSTNSVSVYQDVGISISGNIGYFAIGGAYGANTKTVDLFGNTSVAQNYSFENAVSSIPLFGNTTTPSVGRLKMWTPSSNVFFRSRPLETFPSSHLLYSFSTNNVLYSFNVVGKNTSLVSQTSRRSFISNNLYYVFPTVSVRYSIFTPTRNLVLLSSRPNYYNQG